MAETSRSLYQGELVAACKQKAASFGKYYNTLVLFTLAFGFFVVWPYLAVVQDAATTRAEVRALEREKAALEPELAALDVPYAGMREVSSQVRGGAPMLREYIHALLTQRTFDYPSVDPACQHLVDPARVPEYGMPQMMQMPITPNMAVQQGLPPPGGRPPSYQDPNDSCSAGNQQQRRVCRIERFVQFQICQYGAALENKVIAPLSQSTYTGEPLFEPDTLRQKLETLKQSLAAHIANEPEFWHTVQGKGDMAVRLNEKIESFWDDFQQRLRPVIEALRARIETSTARIATLMERQVEHVERLEALKVRLQKIESPIGVLPISLTEAVLAFPVLLAFSFWFISGILAEHVQLRISLKELEQQPGRDEDAIGSREVARLAALWFDPEDPRHDRLLHALLLLLPLVAFVLSVGFITFVELGANDSLFRQTALGAPVHMGLYLFCVAIFVWCFARLVSAYRLLR